MNPLANLQGNLLGNSLSFAVPTFIINFSPAISLSKLFYCLCLLADLRALHTAQHKRGPGAGRQVPA